MNYQQGTVIEAKYCFTFRSRLGNLVKVKAGALFWVTNTEWEQDVTGYIMIERKGRGCVGSGWAFTPEQVDQLFF